VVARVDRILKEYRVELEAGGILEQPQIVPSHRADRVSVESQLKRHGIIVPLSDFEHSQANRGVCGENRRLRPARFRQARRWMAPERRSLPRSVETSSRPAS